MPFMPFSNLGIWFRCLLAIAIIVGGIYLTLVVVGDQDTTTLLEAGQYISEHVPNARLATLSPAKHLGLIEHHAQFDELVAGFADSCPTTTGSSDGFARRRSMLR
jgi:hypothetical protein